MKDENSVILQLLTFYAVNDFFTKNYKKEVTMNTVLQFFKNKIFHSYFENTVFISILYTFYNYIYYKILFEYDTILITKSIILSFFYFLTVFYCLKIIKYLYNLIIIFVLITSSLVIYFSASFGLAQNKEMFALLFTTNIHEALGVISPLLLLYLIPALFLSFFAIRCRTIRPSRKQYFYTSAVLIITSLLLSLGTPIEHKGKHPMPFGYISHLAHAVKQQYRMSAMIANRQDLPCEAVIQNKNREPMLIVFALGESLRADHLHHYGYDRNTNPYTNKNDFMIFPVVYSAGTWTTEAVPGIMTRSTIANISPRKTEKSVISLFNKAGFRTVWLTNQGAMATGETWVASIAKEASVYKTHPNIYKLNTKLQDVDLLGMLDEELSHMTQDTLIVLHSYGSHIHPEDRYSDPFRVFTPVCTTPSVADCEQDSLINSYDNSVIATDKYWNELILRLKDKNSILIITSDHGVRLYGEFRGAAPNSMDNLELRYVPLMVYASSFFQLPDKIEILKKNLRTPVSHDVLFHSLLGIAGITSSCYQPELDIFSDKLSRYEDPYLKISENP